MAQLPAGRCNIHIAAMGYIPAGQAATGQGGQQHMVAYGAGLFTVAGHIITAH